MFTWCLCEPQLAVLVGATWDGVCNRFRLSILDFAPKLEYVLSVRAHIVFTRLGW